VAGPLADMYDIHDYGDMIADRGRIDAYAQALRQRVTPESVVLDVGAGPGILTLLACRAGARRVYAVEPAGIIEVAREAIAANGYADRVELIQAASTAIDLAEPVDVIVSALHGVLPLFCGSLTAILDARDRFLKPSGVMIPLRETVFAALVSSPSQYRRLVGPWDGSVGLEWAPARRRALNTWTRWKFPAGALVVEPKPWIVLDYAELRTPGAKREVAWTIARPGQAHGLCLWFESETAPGYGFTNSPLSQEDHVFHHAFFPWTEPLALDPGDEVAVEIRADVVGEDYLWSWATDVRGRDGGAKAAFRQSQFLSAPISTAWLRKSGASFVPRPNRQAHIDRTILELLFAGISVEEIARQVAERFPDRFPACQAALTHVGQMSLRYSE
jgi:protein arginine N-methyltransferase 1